MKDIAALTENSKKIVRDNMLRAETEQRFNDDVQPVDWENMQKVTDDFVFIPSNPLKVAWSYAARFIAMAVAKPLCFFGMGSAKIIGREHLKNLGGAVIVCNHVHIFDSFFVRAASFGHRLYITVAEFNNMKGFLGVLLRGAGCLPFSDCFSAMKKLSRTLDSLLGKKCFVLFYPEKSMWPRYEKPRPYSDGAFHVAAKNRVPVVPTFILFKEPSAFRKKISGKKIAELHVLEPVYPKPELDNKENAKYLLNETHRAVCRLYREKTNSDL